MKVYLLPSDAHACGHNRLVWPANVLQQQGHDIVIIPPSKESGFLAKTEQMPDGSERIISLQIPEDADVMVFQRPAHPFQPQVINLLRQNGIAVVIDMDDDMSSIHPDNSAYHMYRHRSNTPYSWRHAADSCRLATYITTSTPQLQKVYAKHGRGQVIDNYVPATYLQYPRVDTGTFGWTGTVKSHPNDLQVTRPAVQQLIDAGWPFAIVGDQRGAKEALRLREDPPASGFVSLADWAKYIATTMDVGLIPLASTSFNASKSRLKGIEYWAVGVAWVASPRAEYRKLLKDAGAGALAETAKDWFREVDFLMKNEVARKEQIEAGFQYMQDQTYEQQAWRWWEAWETAYKIQRQSKISTKIS